jgi:hypothetical protein
MIMDRKPETQSPEFIRFMQDVENLRKKRKEREKKNGKRIDD